MAKTPIGTPPGAKTRSSDALRKETASLKRRLDEAEEALDAIRTGSIDALVVKGPGGDQVYTLQDADRSYRAVLENMRDGAVTIRKDGLVLYANKQFAAMMGHPLESVLGRNLFDLAGSCGRDSLKSLVESADASGARGDVECGAGPESSSLIHFSLAPMAIDDIQVLAGVAADFTEERRTEQRIRQLERTDALGRLAGGVAHDLNNILQPIIVNAELLLEEAEPTGHGRELLRHIVDAANRQKELVRRILSFTRPAKRDLRPLAVTPLIVETMNLLKPSLPRGVEIRLIEGSQSDVVRGDPTELHELVANLCMNAADAMEGTGGTIEISLHDITLAQENAKFGLKPGRYLKLEIKDTGCGIPPEDLQRIFDPFFTTKETGRGTGIGLSVVHGIVKSHGGSISVQSQVGKGTEFLVFLPVVGAGQFEVQKLTADWQRTPSDRRVLLVDDEDFVLDTIRRALASLGHKPTTFKDPRGALSLLRSLPRHFDIAIIDQTMPKMSGLELATEIRKINPDMPILLATGYSKAVDDKSLEEAGVTAVVMKPLSLRDLAIAVNRALAAGRHES